MLSVSEIVVWLAARGGKEFERMPGWRTRIGARR
jgi:hypothetical protein